MGIAVAAILGFILFYFDPARFGFYPVCLFHRTTGLLCPGCGGLRATHQLLHGHFTEAFLLNPLFVAVLLPIGLWLVVRWAVCRIQGRPAALRFRLAWLWAGIVLTLGFGIGRNFF